MVDTGNLVGNQMKNIDSIFVERNLISGKKLNIILQFCGDDFNVSVYGGDKAHIGAVALAIANLEGYNRKYSPTINVLTVMDHKDDEVAKLVAEDLAKEFNVQVVVAAGIHINDITKEELKEIMVNITEMLQEVKGEINKKVNF